MAVVVTAGVVVPAVLAGVAVALAVGVPGPSRLPVLRPTASRPARHLPGAVVPLAAGVAGLVLGGPAAGAVAALLAAAGRRSFRLRRVRAGRAAERSGAVEALAALGAELRAGRAPAEALRRAADTAVGPTGAVLASAARAVEVGADPAAVLLAGADRTGVPVVLRGLAACWQVCSGSGSSLAVAVERLAAGLQRESAQREAVETELAGPRATAAVLAGLPVVGLLLAAGLGARPLHVLLHTSAGGGCLVAGTVLDLLGLWWTGRLVAGAGGDR